MEVEIIRKYGEKQTIGNLTVYKEGQPIFKCFMLEPPWMGNEKNISCIIPKTYTVVKEETSEHHPYPHFRVLDVPGRAGVLWHGGNTYHDTLGCNLPGDSLGDKNKDGIVDVLNSRKTLQNLYDLLPNKFQCTYK